MKKVIAALCCTLLLGCRDGHPTVTVETHASKGATVTRDWGSVSSDTRIDELEYKGHTYLSTEVHGGIALTHAGHCKCNAK